MRLLTMSDAAIESALSEETGETWLIFLDIAIPGGSTIRVVNNWEAVTRGGNEYLPYRFDVGIPNEVDEGLPTVPLRIDNVDLVIIESLLGITQPIPVTMVACLASSPDDVEAGPFNLKIFDVNWDQKDITAEMSFDRQSVEAYPGFRVIPSTHPAAFMG